MAVSNKVISRIQFLINDLFENDDEITTTTDIKTLEPEIRGEPAYDIIKKILYICDGDGGITRLRGSAGPVETAKGKFWHSGFHLSQAMIDRDTGGVIVDRANGEVLWER